jgi:alkylhydroperoxidase family enzyme
MASRTPSAREAGFTEAESLAVLACEDAAFSEAERLALELPAWLGFEPSKAHPDLIAALRRHYTDEQIAELVFWTVLKTASTRLAYSFGLEHALYGD